MTFQDALFQIPIMFYATVVLLPVFITVYFVAGRKKRIVSPKSADPASVLKAQGVNVKRVLSSNILLGVVFGLVFSLVFFIVTIGSEWYYSTGLFAVDLPYDTFPPQINDITPPHPPSYAKTTPSSTNSELEKIIN